MTNDLACPICTMTDLLAVGHGHECITCGHEWAPEAALDAHDQPLVVFDAYGNVLADGDTVQVVKDLRVKGGSSSIKVGTKITGIRLVNGDHEVDCRINGQPMMLKAKFLKKA